MAEIVFDQIKKSYADGNAVIRNLDLAVRDGEFLVLIGPSGCGKSTALRMIAGLEEITDGRLMINGKVVNDLAPRDRDIAMVFQSYALYPHLTVGENIGFGLRVRGLDKTEISRKVAETAKLLELEDYLSRKPGQLSGGQRQRVAMGRALARSPQAFLMDEPLSNLDARLRGQMRAEIARMQKLSGITTVYVTHDQVEAMTMGDRVAVMKGGVLQQLGAPRMLYDQPANLFVAGFMGSPAINLIAADLISADRGAEARFGHSSFHFSDDIMALRPRLRADSGKSVVLGIRPEAFQPVEAGEIAGSVAFIEDLGANLLVHIDVEAAERLQSISAEEDEVTLSQPRLRVIIDGTKRLKLGERLTLTADPRRIHVFDSSSGDVIHG